MRKYTGIRSISMFILTIWLSLSLGCADRKEQRGILKGKNVLLISIDTCRADHVQPYSDTHAQTPAIQSIANDGIWFWDAVTPVPLTLPSHCTMMTGLHPIRHGVRDNFNRKLSEDAVTLAELFQETGYRTAGFVGTILLSRREGISQGFEYYDDRFTPSEYQAMKTIVERRAGRVVSSATAWLQDYLDSPADKPFFMFVHFYDPHMVYEPPMPFSTMYEDSPYDGEIAYTDYCIGQLVSFLKRHGLYDEMLMVLVSDHGEGLRDHKEPHHGLFLYDEAVRVPFIVKLPKDETRFTNVLIDQTVSLEDITPTLIDLCELGPVETTGKNLASLLLHPAQAKQHLTKRNVVLETQYPLFYNWSPMYALRNHDWKYIHAPIPELYHLASDPQEKQNLISQKQNPLSSMQKELEDRLVKMASQASFSTEQTLSADRVEMLASLGYAAGRSSPGIIAPGQSLPDPKEKLDVYILIDKGLGALAQGFPHRSIDAFEQAMRKDPQNPTPYANLGLAYAKVRQWNRAIEYTKKALSLAPQNLLAHMQLVEIYLLCKKEDRAEVILQSLLKDYPRLAQAHFYLGKIFLHKEKFQPALHAFEQAKLWMPDIPGIDALIQQAKEGNHP